MSPHDGADAVRDVVLMADQFQPRLRPLTAAEFLKLELLSRGMILDPWLREKGLVMLYSPRGMGKTLFAMTSGFAVAAGAEFLEFNAPALKLGQRGHRLLMGFTRHDTRDAVLVGLPRRGSKIMDPPRVPLPPKADIPHLSRISLKCQWTKPLSR